MANVSISDLAKNLKEDVDSIVRQFIVNLGDSVIKRSPYGVPEFWEDPSGESYTPDAYHKRTGKHGMNYIPGHFIFNWQHGFGSVPTDLMEGEEKEGNASRKRIRDSVKSSPAAGIHYLVNNTEYADWLEWGWSARQAPKGMVGLAVIEGQMHLDKAIIAVNNKRTDWF